MNEGGREGNLQKQGFWPLAPQLFRIQGGTRQRIFRRSRLLVLPKVLEFWGGSASLLTRWVRKF